MLWRQSEIDVALLSRDELGIDSTRQADIDVVPHVIVLGTR